MSPPAGRPWGRWGPRSARPTGEPAAPPGRRPAAGSGAPHLPHRPGWRRVRAGVPDTPSNRLALSAFSVVRLEIVEELE